MKPMLPTDDDTNIFFDKVVFLLQDNFGYSEVMASNLVHEYYEFFRDAESCDSINVPVQDDDFFFHESARGMALRIYYYLVLKADPDPHAFMKWRASLWRSKN
ncbi:hypothetical protein HYN51_12990 [Limnobaculum parvum]|uniref:Uncharacterized protein n=2 Tax=Limnobaculum parvum TaxID=2172103 RepID=A0A2Y9U1D8_9GAMM|nr:hypothetical protein HYN51_12990 [Limnobaculum parvum]